MSGCKFDVFCLVGLLCIYICTGNSNMKRCVDTDKQALLKLKDGFIDEFNILLSWRDKVDCCTWRGISCNKLTGHVTRLDLQAPNYSAYLKGQIDYSLCELRHLTFLDLSYNYFRGKKIPKCIGSLGELRELKLAATGLSGTVPHELRNLSNLQTLDLSHNHDIIAYDLEWVSHLSSLIYLSLSGVNLSQAISWELSISKAPSLTELKLASCDLAHVNPRSSSHLNSFTSLKVLDLSENDLNTSTLSWVLNISKVLTYLDLSFNSLQGQIPNTLTNMASLEYLDLSYNFDLISKDLEWVSHLSSLRYLNLSGVNLSQAINWELSISKAPSLTELKLASGDLAHVNPQSSSHLNSSTSLKVLDLSENDLNTSTLSWVLNVSKVLTYLDLSFNSLQGQIPNTLTNMASLEYLDLSYNFDLIPNDLEWVSRLSSLRYLHLSSVNLSQAINWELSITKAPSLTNLELVDCELPQVNPLSFAHLNSSTSLKVLDLSKNDLDTSTLSWVLNVSKVLTYLDLSSNSLQSQIPNTWTNMASLEYLDLSYNEIEGGIPKSFHNLCKLKELHLSTNKLSGQLSDSIHQLCSVRGTIEVLDLGNNPFNSKPFPEFQKLPDLRSLYLSNTSVVGSFPQSIGQLPHLSELDLSYNNLSGPLPEFIGSQSLKILNLNNNKLNGTLPNTTGLLSSLVQLYLSSNKLNGVISEAQLSNLPNLTLLDVSHNLLTFNLSSNWIPPLQLEGLFTSGCNLGPRFPAWLKYQREIFLLDISYSGISDSIPNWFWNQSSGLRYLNLSHNQIHGPLRLGNLSFPMYWDFSFNNLSGPLPKLPQNTWGLFLSNNKFSGSLSSFCETSRTQLGLLDLSNNLLSGRVPDQCGEMFPYLLTLNLANNNFSGPIPQSLGALQQIESIHLNNNNFSGDIPSFMHSRALKVIDFGNNHLHGTLPTWMGYDLPNLIVLQLRANKLQGIIPASLCNLLHLQILDLSQNNFSGKIPHCLDNITALSNTNNSREILSYAFGEYEAFEEVIYPLLIENLVLIWKGEVIEYGKNLRLMTAIDLSGNHLVGEIPLCITRLLALASLNLSGNNLAGSIPSNIGQMKMLESLDLSRNSFHGEIPATLSNLSFLSYLNLSFNNLFGKIPPGTQLQSFNASAYMGNNRLCGPPLIELCQQDEGSPSTRSTNSNDIEGEEDEDDFISFGFYVSLGFGFITGFWAVYGTLILKSSWRLAYFQFINKINDQLYIQIIIFTTRIKKCLQN